MSAITFHVVFRYIVMPGSASAVFLKLLLGIIDVNLLLAFCRYHVGLLVSHAVWVFCR